MSDKQLLTQDLHFLAGKKKQRSQVRVQPYGVLMLTYQASHAKNESAPRTQRNNRSEAAKVICAKV